MKSSSGKYALVLFFVALLILPAIDQRLNITNQPPSSENRPLADEPQFELRQLSNYPEAFENYYNDHFRYRARIVKNYNKLCMGTFNRSPIPDKVIVGKNGWLFMGGDDASIFVGNNLFADEELKRIADEFEYRKKYLANRNCKLYVAFVPSKGRVYDEYMPDYIIRTDTLCYSYQLYQYLKKNTSVNAIDLYPVLRKEKKNRRIYFKTDNHWNDIGAYVASQAIIREMKKDFPMLPELPFENIKIDSALSSSGGIVSAMLAIADEVKEMEYWIYPVNGWKAIDGKKHPYIKPESYHFNMEYEHVKAQANSMLPKILVIRDSFGSAFINPFSESFSKAVYILDNWKYKLNEDIANEEKPDIMLFLIYEPLVKNLRWEHSNAPL